MKTKYGKYTVLSLKVFNLFAFGIFNIYIFTISAQVFFQNKIFIRFKKQNVRIYMRYGLQLFCILFVIKLAISGNIFGVNRISNVNDFYFN